MAYTVTRNILDTKDNNRFYEAGDTFPREGLSVSEGRLKQLLELGVIVSTDGIEPVAEPAEKPKRGRKKSESEEG